MLRNHICAVISNIANTDSATLAVLNVYIVKTGGKFTNKFKILRIFKGIRPAVVALIIAPELTTAKAAGINWKTVIIPVTVALLIYSKIPVISNPIIFIVLGAIGGYIYYMVKCYEKSGHNGENGNDGNDQIERKEAGDA